MSAFAMPIFDMSENRVHTHLVPSADELKGAVTRQQFSDWLDVIPVYANQRAADEAKSVHVAFHKFLSKQFPGLGLADVSDNVDHVPENSIKNWRLPACMIKSGSRPDSVGVTQEGVPNYPLYLENSRHPRTRRKPPCLRRLRT